jgi:hypothetical protein
MTPEAALEWLTTVEWSATARSEGFAATTAFTTLLAERDALQAKLAIAYRALKALEPNDEVVSDFLKGNF